jgi:spore maturation protein B
MTALLVPVLLIAVAAWCAARRVDFFAAMIDGARDGLRVVLRILPSPRRAARRRLHAPRLRALDALAQLCTPLFVRLGIPPETAALVFLRPLSGSGALAVGSELMERYGPDSTLGRTAAVMLGSTETTFYVVAVYFGAAGVKKTRHAVPAALAADLTGFSLRRTACGCCFAERGRLFYIFSGALTPMMERLFSMACRVQSLSSRPRRGDLRRRVLDAALRVEAVEARRKLRDVAVDAVRVVVPRRDADLLRQQRERADELALVGSVSSVRSALSAAGTVSPSAARFFSIVQMRAWAYCT